MGRPGCGCCGDKCVTTYRLDKNTGQVLWMKNLGVDTQAICEYKDRVYVFLKEAITTTPHPDRKDVEDIDIKVLGLDYYGITLEIKQHKLDVESRIQFAKKDEFLYNLSVIDVINEDKVLVSDISTSEEVRLRNNEEAATELSSENYVFSEPGFLDIISKYDIVVLDKANGKIILDECIQFLPEFELSWSISNQFQSVNMFGYDDAIYVELKGGGFDGIYKIRDKRIVQFINTSTLDRKKGNLAWKDGYIYSFTAPSFLDVEELRFTLRYNDNITQVHQDIKSKAKVEFVNPNFRLFYFDPDTLLTNTITISIRNDEDGNMMFSGIEEEDFTITQNNNSYVLTLSEKYKNVQILPHASVVYYIIDGNVKARWDDVIDIINGGRTLDVTSPAFMFQSGLATDISEKFGYEVRTQKLNSIEDKTIYEINTTGFHKINLLDKTFETKFNKVKEIPSNLIDNSNNALLDSINFSKILEKPVIVSNQKFSGEIGRGTNTYRFPTFDAYYFSNNNSKKNMDIIQTYLNIVNSDDDDKTYFKPAYTGISPLSIDSNENIYGYCSLGYEKYVPYYTPTFSGDVQSKVSGQYQYTIDLKYVPPKLSDLAPSGTEANPSGKINEIVKVNYSTDELTDFVKVDKVYAIVGTPDFGTANANPISKIITNGNNFEFTESLLSKSNYYFVPPFNENNGLQYTYYDNSYMEGFARFLASNKLRGIYYFLDNNNSTLYNYYYNSNFYFGRENLFLNSNYYYDAPYYINPAYWSNINYWQNGQNYFYSSLNLIKSYASKRLPKILNSNSFLGYRTYGPDNENFDFVNEVISYKKPSVENISIKNQDIYLNGNTSILLWDINYKDWFSVLASNDGYKEIVTSDAGIRNFSTSKFPNQSNLRTISYRYDGFIDNPEMNVQYLKRTVNFFNEPLKPDFFATTKMNLKDITSDSISQKGRALSGKKFLPSSNTSLIKDKYIAFTSESDDEEPSFPTTEHCILEVLNKALITKDITINDGDSVSIEETSRDLSLVKIKDYYIGALPSFNNVGFKLSIKNQLITEPTDRYGTFVPIPSGVDISSGNIDYVFAYGMSGTVNPITDYRLNSEDNFVGTPSPTPIYYKKVEDDEEPVTVNFVPGLAWLDKDKYLVGQPLLELADVPTPSGGYMNIDRKSDTTVDFLYGPSGVFNLKFIGNGMESGMTYKDTNFRYIYHEDVVLVDRFIPITSFSFPIWKDDTISSLPFDNYSQRYMMNIFIPPRINGREDLGLIFGIDLDNEKIVLKKVNKKDNDITTESSSLNIFGFSDITDIERTRHDLSINFVPTAQETQRYNVRRFGDKNWSSAYLPQPAYRTYDEFIGGEDYLNQNLRQIRDGFVSNDSLYLTGDKIRWYKGGEIQTAKRNGEIQSKVGTVDCFEDNSKLNEVVDLMTHSRIVEKESDDAG